MESVDSLLLAARQVLDGEVDCSAPEYRAMDLLHRAVELLNRHAENTAGMVAELQDKQAAPSPDHDEWDGSEFEDE